MASAAENLFCYVVAGFWVEIPEDDSRADVYLLADHDHEKGLEGKAAPFPVKRFDGRKDENGNPSHPATLLAARVWCLHAREQIRADVDPGFDGDGESPLKTPQQPLSAGEQIQADNAAASQDEPSVAQDAPQEKPAPKRRSKKG